MTPFLLVLAAQAQFPDVSPIYRCAFEERSRMVLIKMSPTRWMAFNPKTCAIQKIWDGDVEWRGKVYDFSQNTSRAKGKVLFELPSELWRQSNGAATSWTGRGTKINNEAIEFPADESSIETTSIGVTGFRNIYVAFDETSRAAPFRVQVIEADERLGDRFNSATHGGSDTDWQWNFKQIWPSTRSIKVRWTNPSGKANKKLRNARLFGDYEPFTSDSPIETVWRGYTLLHNRVVLDFSLKLKDREITCGIEVREGGVRFSLAGNLEGVSLRLPAHSGLAIEGREDKEVHPLQHDFYVSLRGQK